MLDIVATIEGIVGEELGPDRVSLLDPPDGDRTVFLQARGEDEDSHIRRYSLRTNEGSCFCERNQETDAIEFGDCSDRSLRDKLEAHVRERIKVENGEAESKSGEIDEEIERRLSALGYKE